MLSYAKSLDRASSTFFFFGFAISQLRFAPFIIAAFAKISSLFLYLVAYVLWLVACQLYPDHPRLKKEWYGFAQFKNQHRIAAALGTIAVLCSILTFFFPIIAVPASWLFAISNGFWLISEYHKKQNPICEENYSSERQQVYLIYALLVTTMAIVTAIATTLITFYPIVTTATILLASLFSLCIGAAAFKYWAEYTFLDYKADNDTKGSYTFFLSNKLVQNAKTSTLEHQGKLESSYYPSPIMSSVPPKKDSQLPLSPSDNNSVFLFN
ncbi:hypothetical protein [Legionella sp.]|uniref:hypothetical protein n=1 Tax=Legionella sp. TaxID=459 RepID=UPI0032207D74